MHDEKKTLKPKLRFPEFRKRKGWEVTTLSSVATFYKGRGISKAEVDPNGSRLCIRYGELYTTYGEVIDHIYSRTNTPADELFFSRKNDVIIPASGETKLEIAKASCVMLDGVALGSDLNVIRSNHNGVFLSYLLNGAKKLDIARLAQGDTVVHLYPSQLEPLSISLPDKDEQQKAANCLTSLSQVIAVQERRVNGLKAHKNGLIQQLFPRDGETIPRLRFPEFRRAPVWRIKKLDALLKETLRPIELDGEKDYSLVTVKRRYGGVVSREVLRGKAIKVRSQFVVRSKDFLISKRQIVHNACGLVPPELEGSVVSNEYSVLTPREGCDIEFFSFFSRQPCVSDSFMQSSVGIVIEKMLFKLNSWLDLEFLFPSLEEQQRIAACLKSIEHEIIAESQKLDALKFHKTGLMQQLFPLTERVEA